MEDIYKQKSSGRRWQDEAWATQKEKQKECPDPQNPKWKKKQDQEWREYISDPDGYVEIIVKDEHDQFKALRAGIRSGAIMEAERSGDAALKGMQKVIGKMARASGLLKRTPKLLVHTAASYLFAGSRNRLSVGVTNKEFIEINEYTKEYFSREPEQFKAVMAHELAHIARGDCSPESSVEYHLTPPNQKRENLADRLGAIIHGNPRQYAQSISDFVFHDTQENGVKPYHFRLHTLSANATARMVHKWADILEDEHAVDDKGNVIREQALEVFRRSVAVTERYLEVSLRAGVTHPKPPAKR